MAEIIRSFYKDRKVTCPHDPATKIFLALRITVNNELKNLNVALVDLGTQTKTEQILLKLRAKDEEKRKTVLSSILNTVFIISVLLSTIGLIFTNQISFLLLGS